MHRAHLQRVTSESRDHYTLLVERHAADLHAYFLRRFETQDDAADAVSDVLMTAWRRRSATPTDPTEARMWLFGIAANVLRNSRRSRARQHAVQSRLAADRTVPSNEHAAASSTDAAEGVRDAIQALPEQAAELVRLHHWEGFTLQEVSTILAIPASTVRTRYATARAQLRELLQDPDDANEQGHHSSEAASRR